MTTAIIKFEQDRQALARAHQAISGCHTLPEIKQLVNLAESFQICARKADAGRPLLLEAGIIAVNAMSRAGEILAQIPRKPGVSQPNSKLELGYTALIKKNGVPHVVAHRWQKMGEVPELLKLAYFAGVQASNKGEITPAGVLGSKEVRAFFRSQKKKEYTAKIAEMRPKKLEPPYRVIYADPPWKYVGLNQADEYGHAERHYDCLDDDQLKKYKVGGKRLVRDMTDKNAVLFLWVTSPLLERCFAIIEAWGFEYKSSFVWDKVKHNMGHYNSVRHELLLIATKGACKPDVPKLVDSVVSIERTKHSAKPEEFRKIIENLYDHGRKLELFRRGAAPEGWDAEGNETI